MIEDGSAYSPLKVFHHADRLRVLREGGQPAPTQVQLIISDLCNHSCKFCAYRWEEYTSNQLFREILPDGSVNNNPKRMIPYEKVVEILDDCVAMGVKAVQITGGGEPTVHPRHRDVFRAVLDRGLDFALVSNGAIFREGVIPLLLRAKWVRFSLDAGNAETYAAIRRVPATHFERTLANVRSLCEARDAAGSDLIVGVGFVVGRENWREVVSAARLAKAVGADNLRVSAVFQPDDADYFAGFHDEAHVLCSEAATLGDDRFRVFNNFSERLEDLAEKAPDYSFCGYQHFSAYVGADLNVYRCCVQAYNERGLVGSISDRRFRDLWESQEKRDAYASFDARECERCMFNNKNRTIAYACSSNPAHVNFV